MPAKLLLGSGANVNATNRDGRNALLTATLTGAPEMVSLLRDFNASGPGDVFDAAMKGDLEWVKAFLKSGANINAPFEGSTTAYHYDEYTGILASSETIIAGSVLFYMCHDVEAVEYLVGAKANVNAMASVNSTFYDPNNQNPFDLGTVHGVTVLMYAIDSLDTVGLLIQAGANVNAADSDGRTALMRASENGNVAVVKLLIAAKANLNTKDSKGVSALNLSHNHRQVFDALRAAGAKLDASDSAALAGMGNTSTGTMVWTRTSDYRFQSLSFAADGSHLAACEVDAGSEVYTSADAGQSWAEQ